MHVPLQHPSGLLRSQGWPERAQQVGVGKAGGNEAHLPLQQFPWLLGQAPPLGTQTDGLTHIVFVGVQVVLQRCLSSLLFL